MAKNLVIVESPTKIKTLKKFLGSNYKIEASVGHVRDLPKSDFGVDVENDYEPKYITIRGKGDVLSKLRKEVKAAQKVYLATDPDREGEAISWHLMHALKLDEKNTARITFNEITKSAVTQSIKAARGIDMNLVNAQQARRVLDRIVGYRISPLLWKKVRKGLSAGRVQSAALKIICDREEEINGFVPEEYWTLEAELQKGSAKFTARYNETDNGKKELKTKEDVDAVLASADGAAFTVQDVKNGARSKKPAAPFTTSTLQQEASKLLGFAPSKTMLVAQQLYEGVDVKGEGTVGLVTYIRTDSARVSDEAYEETKKYIEGSFGNRYVSPERPQYKAKGRSQDAHEAIRPTQTERAPDSLKDSLTREQFRLYKLIWERFVSSQMAPAQYDTLTVKIAAAKGGAKPVIFRASGSVLKFDGYLTVYSKNEDSERDVRMPELKPGDALKLLKFLPEQHFTQPPPRYSEAQLVRAMEELSIGRPSTYAVTISTLVSRGYLVRESKVFYPTELGEVVNEIMSDNFNDIVDVEFTAKMEDSLDKVETGEIDWKNILRGFYPPLEAKIKTAEESLGHIDIKDEVTDILCENCGRNMVIKNGRFGKFLACPGFPECRNTKPLFEEAGVSCPLCGGKVLVKKSKKGRKYFGCERNIECGFMSWNKPTGRKCPLCGEYLVEKGFREKREACSNASCKYSAVLEEADA
ncbi:MAG: type I DNA topoisomerase [Clostridiales bacterium]|jgi:DNA topoisomerase-1|nr:type I DNA topoisomerase [Clostridiales bacterium]